MRSACFLDESALFMDSPAPPIVLDESSCSLYSAHLSSTSQSTSQSSFQSEPEPGPGPGTASAHLSPPLMTPISLPLYDNGPNSFLMRYIELIEESPKSTIVQPDPRRAHLGHLQVAQPVQTRGGSRRFYDNINVLEGLGFLRRGAQADRLGERYRFVTWYGNRYMEPDFRRLYDEGERAGLVRAVELFKAGVPPSSDSFTTALDMNHDEGSPGVYSMTRPERSRGKCPIKVAAQRILIILMAARGRMSSEAISHLLLLPYADVSLKRRYFAIRDILVTFGIAEASKRRRRENCLQYCGPAPRPILRHLLDLTETVGEAGPTVVPLCVYDAENNLLPLFTAEPATNEEEDKENETPQAENVETVVEETPQEAEVMEERPHIDLVPASLFDDFDTAALTAQVFEEKEDLWPEDEMLLQHNSDGSTRLNRTETLLPWTESR